MHLTIAYSKIKRRNLVLINNDTYQRETLSERPIRRPLTVILVNINCGMLVPKPIIENSCKVFLSSSLMCINPKKQLFSCLKLVIGVWNCQMLTLLFAWKCRIFRTYSIPGSTSHPLTYAIETSKHTSYTSFRRNIPDLTQFDIVLQYLYSWLSWTLSYFYYCNVCSSVVEAIMIMTWKFWS